MKGGGNNIVGKGDFCLKYGSNHQFSQGDVQVFGKAVFVEMNHLGDDFLGIKRGQEKAINGIFIFAGKTSFAMRRDIFFAKRADLGGAEREVFQASGAKPNVRFAAD